MPESFERRFFTPVEVDGIVIWYDTNKVRQAEPGQPIHIGLDKVLFLKYLTAEGVVESTAC
jgi:hypothetical protein